MFGKILAHGFYLKLLTLVKILNLMTLDFNFEIKDLSGESAKDDKGNPTIAGKVLAQELASSNKGNAIKLSDWAHKLWNLQPIEADLTDAEIIIEFVNNSEWLTNLSKAPILKYIKSQQEL